MNHSLHPAFRDAMDDEADRFVLSLDWPDGATYPASQDARSAYCGDLTPGQQEAAYALGM